MLYNFFLLFFFLKRKGHLAREMTKMIFLYVAVSHDYKHVKEAMRKTLQHVICYKKVFKRHEKKLLLKKHLLTNCLVMINFVDSKAF